MKSKYTSTRLACYIGFVTQAVTINLPPILFIIFRSNYGLSYEQLGRVVLLNFLTQLAVDILAGWFAHKIGVRRCAVIAHLACAAGLISLGLLPLIMASVPYAAILISCIIYASGAGLLEVFLSPTMESLPSESKSASMSILHSFYCWGQAFVVLLSTLFILAFGNDFWYILPVSWSIIPIVNMILFTKVPLAPPAPEETITCLRELFGSRTLILAFIIMTCAGAAELSMSQWASMLAERGLGLPKVWGDILGPCLFAILMGSTRVLNAVSFKKIKITTLLLFSSILCITCYALTVLSPSPVFSMIGCVLCGVSVALMWPSTLSFAAERFPSGGTRMFAILAAFGDIGCSAGPWLSGLVSDLVLKNNSLTARAAAAGISADQLGLKSGLASAAIFPVIMLICLLIIRGKKSDPVN